MIKQLISAITLATMSAVPAMAQLTRISNDTFVAEDAQDRVHIIQYIRQDHEGDVQVKVTVGSNVMYYWVNCSQDRISKGGDYFDGWDYVDHRKMEGYYSDVACRR